MSKPFDPTKPVRTRDGRPARIICRDRKGDDPLVVLTVTGHDEETVGYRRSDGTTSWDAPDWDLVNIPEKIEGWLNIYNPCRPDAPEFLRAYATRSEADAAHNAYAPHRQRFACVKVSFEEGEGL